MTTTIQVDNDIKKQLELLKIHKRETYNELILRLINNFSKENYSKENLLETIEILSDPIAMRNIAKGLNEKGGTPLEEVEKELGLK